MKRAQRKNEKANQQYIIFYKAKIGLVLKSVKGLAM